MFSDRQRQAAVHTLLVRNGWKLCWAHPTFLHYDATKHHPLTEIRDFLYEAEVIKELDGRDCEFFFELDGEDKSAAAHTHVRAVYYRPK